MRKTFFLTVVLAVGVSMITACGTSGSFTIHLDSSVWLADNLPKGSSPDVSCG